MAIAETIRHQLGVDVGGRFELGAARDRVAQAFSMETRYFHFLPSGENGASEQYDLKLAFAPAAPTGNAGDQYTCIELAVHTADGGSITIPELSGWSYCFDPTLTGMDARGPMWGISQERFYALTDGSGNALPFATRYAAYTTLIDFHSVNDVFSRPMPFGSAIQNLTTMGQRIIHLASNIEAPVNFGTEVKKGSTFRNGEIALELKGVSVVDGAACALIGYDARDGRLKMIIAGQDGEDAVTEGDSQFGGDIYIDLANLSVRKATLQEYMIAQTRVASSDSTEFTVRHIEIRQIARRGLA